MKGAPNQRASWLLPPRRAPSELPSAELLERRASSGVLIPEAGAGLTVAWEETAGVPCLVCSPGQPAATVLWFHGGGYRLGSAVASAAFGMNLARAAALRVVLVDYPLAPEHPFPAALWAAASVYETRCSGPGPLLVGGDSAGGGLAMALVVAAARARQPRPAGVVLLSPWLDLRVRSASYASRAETDQLFSSSSGREAARLYLQGWPAEDPLASPLLAELDGSPPTAVFASTDEVLLDDARELVHRLSETGTEVTAHLVPGVPHVWPVLLPEHPASVAALTEIARFADLRVADPGGAPSGATGSVGGTGVRVPGAGFGRPEGGA